MAVFDQAFPALNGPRIVVQVVRLDLDPGDGARSETPPGGDLRRAGFLAGRRALRAHLATLLGCVPEEVPLRREEGGRPYLAGSDLCVSASRSGAWLAIGTSRDCGVGVDVEAIRPLPGLDAVVEHLLPPRGRAEGLAAARADRVPVVLRWWTRIEAAVKACGEGLDAASCCLAAAPQVSCEAAPGLALAAAGAVRGAHPQVEWRLPGTLR